jgi:Uma2 family endonuclease
MSQVAVSKPVPVGRSCVLESADWKTYTRLLRVFAEQHNIRLTYDRGRLEMMTPLLAHDDDSRFLGRLVGALTEELALPLKSGGSVTLRHQPREQGVEADECFWIANAHRMRGRRRLNLRIDPPPDLAIEVDVTHSSLDRLAIYAALNVPEVWRLDGDELGFHVLSSRGAYELAERSRAFPILAPADALRFLQQAQRSEDENAVLRRFRAWIRKKIAGRR